MRARRVSGENRTAGDLVKTYYPRGGPSPRARQAAELRDKGLNYEQIATELGVSAKSVSQYLSDSRDVIEGGRSR